MPQTFHVLRCCRCEVFQVQQEKKVKKWTCKMCGEKQSVLRVYGQGTGLECRKHVQKLNMMRGEKDLLMEQQQQQQRECEFMVDVPTVQDQQNNSNAQAQSTKWAQYVEKEDEDEDAGDADPVYTTDRSAFDQARKDNRKIQRKSYQRPHGSSPYASATKTSLTNHSAAGRYRSATPGASSQCSEAPAGRYRSAAPGASSQCSEAPAGRYRSAAPGASSQCSEAPAGRYRSATPGASSQCSEAPAGRYRSGAPGASSQCSEAPAGRYRSAAPGASSQCSEEAVRQSGQKENQLRKEANKTVYRPAGITEWKSFAADIPQNESDIIEGETNTMTERPFSYNHGLSVKSKWSPTFMNSQNGNTDKTQSNSQTRGWDSSHNVPSLPSSSHNAPVACGAPTVEQNPTKSNFPSATKNIPVKKQTVSTDSKWGKFLIDGNDNDDDEEEEEEEGDITGHSDRGQILVEMEGLHADTVKSETFSVNTEKVKTPFNVDQNFDLEFDDW